MNSHETSNDSRAVGHEVRDVRFRPLVLASIGLALAVLAAMAGMKGLFDLLSAREARRSAAVSPLSAAARRHEPPAPRLQTAPIQDLKQLRELEQTQLEGYAWVDRASGKVHIPIERAMELLAARSGQGTGTGDEPKATGR